MVVIAVENDLGVVVDSDRAMDQWNEEEVVVPVELKLAARGQSCWEQLVAVPERLVVEGIASMAVIVELDCRSLLKLQVSWK